MATTYEKFGKFVKVNTLNAYNSIKSDPAYAGSIIFGEFSDNPYKRLYANGIEYAVIDPSYILFYTDAPMSNNDANVTQIANNKLCDAKTVLALIKYYAS